MTDYHVSWSVIIEADSIEEAAIEAMNIQRNSRSFATVFEVTPRCTDCCDGFHIQRDSKEVDAMRIGNNHVN